MSEVAQGKKIIFTVTNNLETDQRVHKVASFFHENNWKVLVIGSNHRKCNDYKQPYETKRLNVWFKHGPLFYAEFNLRLFFFLLFEKTDRIWGNDTDTALSTFIAAKLKGCDYSLDLHELFPEVPEVTQRKFVKFCWTKIEDFVFPYVKDGYTVCESISNYYQKRYNVNLKVLRNVPFKREYNRGNKFDGMFRTVEGAGKKIILYQGAVNEGRGIEWLIQAMAFINNAQLVIIGIGDLLENIKVLAHHLNVDDKVSFFGFIPFQELNAYTASADLGVCLLEDKGLSYYYALPNRIFDFMQAHVPILCTDFPEIARIINQEGTGRVINHYEPEYLASVITDMLNEPINHKRYEEATQHNNWESERRIIRL